MTQDLRLRSRRIPAFLLVVLAASLPFFSLAFFPNYLTDRLFSRVCAGLWGRPVTLHRIRLEFPLGVSFRAAEFGQIGGRPEALARFGQARFSASGGEWLFAIREIDLEGLIEAFSPASVRLIRQQGLSDWLFMRNTRWRFKREGETSYLRLLDAEAGNGSLRGGLRFDGAVLSKADLILWLPEAVWSRFPKLIEKRFVEDNRHRRLFKLTWKNGRWTLWGRSAPVLEARWK